MADVFLSYSSADRNRVSLLADKLVNAGISVWWDRALVAGESYEAEIDKALLAAKAIVVVWTPAAAASEWVRSEADDARGQGKLVPILLEPCRPPKPFDRFHTQDMSGWRGDFGNQGFPELVEALQSRIEGRTARAIPWRRRLTLAAVGSSALGLLVAVSSITGLADFALRRFSSDAFAARSSSQLAAGDAAAPQTQEGFRQALSELAESFDLRTQRALTTLDKGSRPEALAALRTLAEDQGQAIEGQMQRAASLWRQIGLLRFNESPSEAIAALEQARRFSPTDPTILTPLGALYARVGRVADAEETYRRVLAQGAIKGQDEGRVRQVIGQAKLDRGELDAAQREFETALELSRQAGDEYLEADLSVDLGRVDLARGDTEAARRNFADARDFATALGYSAAVGYADLNEAESLIADANYVEASKRLQDAEQAADPIADRYLKLFVSLSVAKIANQTREHARALDIAMAVAVEANQSNLPLAALEAQVQQADALTGLGRFEEAILAADKAATGYKALGSASDLAIAKALAAAAGAKKNNASKEACEPLLAALDTAPQVSRHERSSESPQAPSASADNNRYEPHCERSTVLAPLLAVKLGSCRWMH